MVLTVSLIQGFFVDFETPYIFLPQDWQSNTGLFTEGEDDILLSVTVFKQR